MAGTISAFNLSLWNQTTLFWRRPNTQGEQRMNEVKGKHKVTEYSQDFSMRIKDIALGVLDSHYTAKNLGGENDRVYRGGKRGFLRVILFD